MKLSIVIPLYNCTETIERTLNSLNCVAPEHRQDVEVLCSDDGSRDQSLEAAKNIASSSTGFQWQFISHPNTGVSGARNRALQVAQGEWVLYIDDDDELCTDPIPFLAQVGLNVSSLCFPVERFFDRTGKGKLIFPTRLHHSQDRLLNLFTAEVPFNICAVVFRREKMKHLFDINLKYLEDWMFWLQNFRLFLNVAYPKTRRPLARVHLHGHNRTSCYFQTGVARSQIASELLQASHWSPTQAENLRMQDMIGKILQHQKMSLTEIVTCRCSSILKIKALTYWMFGKRIGLIHPYKPDSV